MRPRIVADLHGRDRGEVWRMGDLGGGRRVRGRAGGGCIGCVRCGVTDSMGGAVRHRSGNGGLMEFGEELDEHPPGT
jgi:hypothetical protein